MSVKYKAVKSSNIDGYYYSEKEKQLYIKFLIQREYVYSDVTKEEMDEVLKAESFSKKFREIIMGKKQVKEVTEVIW